MEEVEADNYSQQADDAHVTAVIASALPAFQAPMNR